MKRVLILFCSFLFFISTLLSVSADDEYKVYVDGIDGFEWAYQQMLDMQYYNAEIMSRSIGTSQYPALNSSTDGSTFMVSVDNNYSSGVREIWQRLNGSSEVTYNLDDFLPYGVGYNQTWMRNGLFCYYDNVEYVKSGQSFNAVFGFYSYPQVALSESLFDIDLYTDYGYIDLPNDFTLDIYATTSNSASIQLTCDDVSVPFTGVRIIYTQEKTDSSSYIGFPVCEVHIQENSTEALNQIVPLVSSINSNTNSILTEFDTILTALNNLPVDIYTSFYSELHAMYNRQWTTVTAINSLPESIYTQFESTLSNLKVNLDNFVNTDFPSFSNTIYSYFDNLPQRIADAINGIGEDEENLENTEQVGSVDNAATQIGNATNVDTEAVGNAVTITADDLSTLVGGGQFIDKLWGDLDTTVPEIFILCTFSLSIGLCCYILGRKLS